MNESLGDRMKSYENRFTNDSFLPNLPVIVRLDGKAFHSWTKGIEKPFDKNFVKLMCDTAVALIGETHPVIAYIQSDEITLIFYKEDFKSQIYFDGKVFKLNSVCASIATAYFNYYAQENFSDKPLAFFDCRSFQVPSKWEAVNCLIWRELDATRNSILSAGQANFSQKQLQGLNIKQIQEKLFQEKGINWNDYPDYFKKGTYITRNGELNIPPLNKIFNAPEVIFDGVVPLDKERMQLIIDYGVIS
jgi:tRNA(His) guanylyltransferase